MSYIRHLLAKQSDILLVGAMVGVLAVLIMPLPTWILDILISVNISVSVFIMILTISVRNPLELSTFPTILLFLTLFRLSLNVASTRLILLQGDAGSVIMAFGQFVVGGNAVVGLIIFLILVMIQFIVITKGATRIAEVAARFTLDAMPGKQMSIDAELNTGAINEKEAQRRRQQINQEAEFYGAMDGAGKFVRGDAIAGLIITGINIVGGVILGFRRGLSIEEAVQTYTILTVGDGLVSQIPSLLVSLATGILVTKSSSESFLSSDLASQFSRYPHTVGMTSLVLACFVLMPGLPKVPFFIMAVCFGGGFYCLSHFFNETRGQPEGKEDTPKEDEEEKPPDDMELCISPDRISVELGYQILSLVQNGKEPSLMERIKLLRQQLAMELGILIPPVHVMDNAQINPNTYRILLDGQVIGEDRLFTNQVLAIDGGMVQGKLPGIEIREPSFGLRAFWINRDQRDEAESLGYTVTEPGLIFITHFSELMKRSAPEILSRDDVHALIENQKKLTPVLVDTIIPNLLSLGEIQQVLRNLLCEGVPIRNLSKILETVAQKAPQTKDLVQLTEHVRKNLGRLVCAPYQNKEGILYAMTLDPALEQDIRRAIAPSTPEEKIVLSPTFLQFFINALTNAKKNTFLPDGEPVLVVHGDIRRGLRELISYSLPNFPVLSFQEILKVQEIKNVAIIRIPRE